MEGGSIRGTSFCGLSLVILVFLSHTQQNTNNPTCKSCMHACSKQSTVAISKFIKDSHWRSALREATAAFKLEVTASATFLGIQHKILQFYYIMCKQDITYCLTSEVRGEQGFICAFMCTIYTHKFMYEHNRFFSFLMRFILYIGSFCTLLFVFSH